MKNQIIILAFTFIVSSLIAQQKGINQLPTANRQLPTSTYAVVVGISDYQDPGIPDLKYADKDAEAFANFLRSNAGGKLDNDHLKVLINEKATVAQFAIQLDWLLENAKENDKVIIYFSGHGDVEKKTVSQPGYLLCWDAPARVYLAGGAMALPMYQDIITTLSTQNKSKVIVITDACHSGKLAGSSIGGSQITGTNLAKQYANEIKILSCQPNEFSIEGEQWGGGRGAFSFHLIDALYGMADKDEDKIVSLQEVGRYLEDHVTNDVSPVRQVPMIIGDRYENLTRVDDDMVSKIRKGKNNQMAMLAPIESRGIEEEVLSKADSEFRKTYNEFKNALQNKKFMAPSNSCADAYFEILIKEPSLSQLHTTMKRNYAAALQDEAQQVINQWLNSDPREITLSKFKQLSKYEVYPRYLERAIELLGKNHYMYSKLQANKLFFEAYLKHIGLMYLKVLDQKFGDEVLLKYREALSFQPESPLIYFNLISLYFYQFNKADSAEYYAQKATDLSPSWLMPYSILGQYYAQIILTNGKITSDLEKSKYFLDKAEKIDSSAAKSNPVYISYRQAYYMASNQLDKAESLMLHLIQIDSTLSWGYANLATTYLLGKRYAEAEKYYQKAILLDPEVVEFYYNLAIVYFETKKYLESEKLYKKVIRMDSNFVNAYYNLGIIHMDLMQWPEAESCFDKCIRLDSTDAISYYKLHVIYKNTNRISKSEEFLLKSISLDSSNVYALLDLAWIYFQTQKNRDAEFFIFKVLQLDPDNPTVFLNIAILYSEINEIQKSWEFLEKAIVKGYNNYELIIDNERLRTFRDQKDKWNDLMKKYFPDK